MLAELSKPSRRLPILELRETITPQALGSPITTSCELIHGSDTVIEHANDPACLPPPNQDIEQEVGWEQRASAPFLFSGQYSLAHSGRHSWHPTLVSNMFRHQSADRYAMTSALYAASLMSGPIMGALLR